MRSSVAISSPVDAPMAKQARRVRPRTVPGSHRGRLRAEAPFQRGDLRRRQWLSADASVVGPGSGVGRTAQVIDEAGALVVELPDQLLKSVKVCRSASDRWRGSR